jgi:hypothetical protein
MHSLGREMNATMTCQDIELGMQCKQRSDTKKSEQILKAPTTLSQLMLGNLKRVYLVLKAHTPNGVLGKEFTLEVRKVVKKIYLQSDVDYKY